MFEQTFKNIDDILHKDAGCGSELDYVEQTSCILFLKYLDDFEKDKKTAVELSGKHYTPIINFPIKTGETASLFLQHFIKIIKAGGKAGVKLVPSLCANLRLEEFLICTKQKHNCFTI
jgi:type I restriction-modification system DNA methylase subunit